MAYISVLLEMAKEILAYLGEVTASDIIDIVEGGIAQIIG